MELKAIASDITANMVNKKQFDEFSRSVEVFSDLIDDLTKSIGEIKQNEIELTKKVTLLEGINVEFEIRISQSEGRIFYLEQ